MPAILHKVALPLGDRKYPLANWPTGTPPGADLASVTGNAFGKWQGKGLTSFEPICESVPEKMAFEAERFEGGRSRP